MEWHENDGISSECHWKEIEMMEWSQNDFWMMEGHKNDELTWMVEWHYHDGWHKNELEMMEWH